MPVNIILPALLTVLGLLMVVFGWFMVKVIGSVTDSIAKLNDQILKLTGLLSGMNAIQLSAQDGCSRRHKDIHDKLEEHSNKLSSHSGDIRVLQEKIK